MLIILLPFKIIIIYSLENYQSIHQGRQDKELVTIVSTYRIKKNICINLSDNKVKLSFKYSPNSSLK